MRLRTNVMILTIIKIVILLSGLTILTPQSGAHTPDDNRPMSLRECLLYARSHSRENRIRRLEEEMAKADKGMAASALMPEVSLSGNGNISFGRNIDPETNTYDNKKTLYTGFGLGASMPLFDGLARINTLKAYRIAMLKSRKATEATEDMTSFAVIKAFYKALYCKAIVDQMEEQLDRDRRILAATRLGEETGTKSGADVAEIEALVASDEYELLNSRNLLSKAYLDLRYEMGMEPTGEQLELYDDTAGISFTDEPSFRPDIADVNPRIAEATLAVKEGLYNLRSAKGQLFPRISVNGGISTSYYRMIGDHGAAPGFSKQWHDNMGQYIGMSIIIPLFTGLSNINRIKRAKAEYIERQTRLDQTRLEIERLKEEAAIDFRGSVEEWRSAGVRLEAEKTAYKAVERKFELGSASAIDLSTAGTRLIKARAALESKRAEAVISRITLEYYYGRPLIR